MTYIGIDPGKKGGMAVLEEGIIFAISFDPQKYYDTLSTCDPKQTIVCLEHVWGRPTDGGKQAFVFGENYGWIQGVLFSLGIPYQIVSPQKWQSEFGVADKNSSIEICKRLHPGINLKRTAKSKKDDDGMSDAALLAEYARRKFGRE